MILTKLLTAYISLKLIGIYLIIGSPIYTLAPKNLSDSLARFFIFSISSFKFNNTRIIKGPSRTSSYNYVREINTLIIISA